MKRANRVLLLVTQADWGGVQQFLLHFAKQLQAEGRTVLLAAGGEGELEAEAQKNGVPYLKLLHMKRDLDLIEDWKSIQEIQDLIQRFQPDAVHLNSSKMGVLGAIAARPNTQRQTNPWVVYRIGGWSFLEPMPRWKQLMYQFAEQWTAKLKDVILTVHPGDETLARSLNILPRHKLMTVANGLDVQAFESQLRPRDEARKALNLPPDAFVFGTVANTYPAKDLPSYIATADIVLGQDSKAMCVILGDGPEMESLKAIHGILKNKGRIILAGRRADAVTLYRAFDAFVLPSKKEGMPWAVLEAMASSLPCLTTDVGSCRWMLEPDATQPGGIVVPAQDQGALQAAMETLLNEETKRRALSKEARRIVETRFSWQATYQGHLDALDQSV